ncbi:MAG: alpha/beta fold hydrolase [Patescibacteria group bacterium]|nr:alpha/beta fold hydrolase [Patescibacteria group bacterium]
MNKPQLIFVHGMFCHAGVFEKMVKYFSKRGYHCLVPNLPYHDQPPHEEPDPRLGITSIVDYVQHVKQVIATEVEKGREHVLIGHSMGGLISMIAASLPEVNPKSLVLLSPAAPWGVVAFRRSVIKSFFKNMTTIGFWHEPIKMSFKDLEYAMLNQVPREQRHRIYSGLKWESGRAAFEMGFWVIDRHFATKFDPRGIKCPVTIYVGSEDRITPAAVVKKTAKVLSQIPLHRTMAAKAIRLLGKPTEIDQSPRVEFIILDGLGHWLLTEMDFRLLEEKLTKG